MATPTIQTSDSPHTRKARPTGAPAKAYEDVRRAGKAHRFAHLFADVGGTVEAIRALDPKSWGQATDALAAWRKAHRPVDGNPSLPSQATVDEILVMMADLEAGQCAFCLNHT
jgi:hypothetical protein